MFALIPKVFMYKYAHLSLTSRTSHHNLWSLNLSWVCTKNNNKHLIWAKIDRKLCLCIHSTSLMKDGKGTCAALYFTFLSTYYIACGTHSLFISCSIILDLNPLKFMHDGMMNPISNKELLACFWYDQSQMQHKKMMAKSSSYFWPP